MGERKSKGKQLMVFVLDQKKRPLMPCTPKRARLMLARGRAVIHRVHPFVIRLKDRRVEDCVLLPIALKIDPGSKTTGMALAREETTEAGKIHVGRVQVRKSGFFDIQTREKEVEGVNAKYCSLVQRADGYDYAIS